MLTPCHLWYAALPAQSFIKAWKAWDKKNKSENDPIAGLPHHQLYAVFAMANCGKDLEVYQLQGFDQARSMMLQVGAGRGRQLQLQLPWHLCIVTCVAALSRGLNW